MINKNKKSIKILDCTLRDGGYYNNWDFDNYLIQKYLKEIEKSNIKDIEIGFRFFDQKYFLGALAYSTDNFLNKLKISKKTNICVMVNSSDLINNKKKIKYLFSKKNNSKVSTIRFATHFRELKFIVPYLKQAKKLNYKIIVNLMQSNDRSEREIKEAILTLQNAGCVSVLYFADSLGKMTPEEIAKLFTLAKKYWKKDLGIHTHDNKGLALQNTIEAIKNGAEWVDATILGMGRGAGNVQTEILLAELISKQNIKYKLEPIYRLSEDLFLDLKNKYKWGKSLNYYIAAENNIHPTYIQTLESDPRYSKQNVYDAINFLKKIDAKSYDKNKLSNFLDIDTNEYKGKWNAKNWCKNKNVLLIGPGKSIEKYKIDIENIIKEKKLTSISLNINKIINQNLIDYYVASNENRIMIDINKYSKIKKPIIMPYARIKKFFKKFKQKKIKDFGLKISKRKIGLNINYCTLPNSLVFGYAISLCIIGKCKKIFLVGFDGHNLNSSEQEEMLDLIRKFKNKLNKNQLISLTPTLYPFNKSSIYAKNL